jgi:hypothetical protein
MRMRATTALIKAVLVLASMVATAAAAVNPSVLVGSSRFTAASIRHHVAALASPAWGGRALASPGADSAAAYVRRQLRAVGLDPGTREGTYDISFPVPTAARVEGVIGLRDRRRGYTFGLDRSPLGFASKGHVLAPLSVAGYGISVSEAGYDDYADLFVKALDARRHGALGLFVVGPLPGPGGTSPVWRINQEQGFPDAGIPACHLSGAAAESLLSESGLDLGALRRSEPLVASHFPVDSACDSVEVISGLRRLEGSAADIVGRLPGRMDGTVVVAAAYDGWGIGPDNSSGVLHPGAGDNAAGVALLPELAGAMRDVLPPDRSILFVAYAGRVFDAAGMAPLVERMTAPGELDPDGLARLARYIYGIVRALASEKTGFSGRGTEA